MPAGQVLEFTRVTKRFNDVTAVSDFSARVEPGVVTAFVGPNGAGKTTTLRILLGQVRATSGTATIGGVAFPELRHPLRTIGSVLEETVYRPRRSAIRQLTIAAKANGIPLSRVGEVLALVGLENEGEGRIGSFSLGMRQRLSVAHALLGDAGALVFDEPANGLDPEGIRWMRMLMRRLADEGRTVLVSSHVLSEVEQVADHVLVLSKGRLMLSSGIEKLADPATGSVVVDSADRAGLRAALSASGFEVEVLRSGLTVRGADAGRVGAIAASAGIALSTLVQRGPTLEDVFIDLVKGGKLVHREEIAAPLGTVAAAEDADEASAVDSAPVEDSVVADSNVADSNVADSDDEVAEETTSIESAVVDEGSTVDADQDASGEAADTDGDVDGDVGADAADGASASADSSDEHAADAPGDDVTGAASDSDGRPSFDQILFGAAPDLADSLKSVEAFEAGHGHTSDMPADQDSHDADADGDQAEPSGVEVFAELREAEASRHDDASQDDGASQDERSEYDAAQDDAAQEDSAKDESASEDDERSASVSSMLAAAARAYYEDEPRDYPHGPDAAESGESGDKVATENASDDAARDSEHHEHHEGEHHEHHEGEHHEGEHHEHR
nr:ATP-binding cassette domain-containing protein [uncultured Microbacterium sp.]